MKQTLQNLLHKKSTYIVLAVVAVLGWWLMGRPGENKVLVNMVHVTVAPVKTHDVPVTVALVGTVVAYETVAIKSRLDSQITDVHFHDGDYVKEGQVLFDLDDRAIKAQIEQLAAALEKEKAQLVNAGLQYERAQKLIKTHVVAQAQVDETRAAYIGQQAQVTAAQANLDNARVQLTYTKILAPITGKTGTINVTRGNNVKANDTQALVTINQVTPIRVQFSIPQRYYDQVKAVMTQGSGKVQAQNKESKEMTEGKLEYVDNAIDVTNGTFAVRAVFENKDEKLWPGMFVNVKLDLGLEKDAMTVPAVAVQGDEGSRFVFIVTQDDKGQKKAARKAVEISLNNGDIAIVTKGLEATDNVIVDGILRVTDGAVLDVSPPAGAKKADKADDSKSPKP